MSRASPTCPFGARPGQRHRLRVPAARRFGRVAPAIGVGPTDRAPRPDCVAAWCAGTL